ncbi:phenylacetyl-CoA ligase [Coprinopsis cinerea AmutBmut pab1-1]|nr:phenylacetyl-CoA ligase [Coprinopsis cinerea AmutBmut pab1-1]
MTIFRSPVPLPAFPDDLTVPQFMFSPAPNRPLRPRNVPFFIEDATGRRVSYEEAHYRTFALANAFHLKWGIKNEDVVCIFSPNHIDYAPVLWGVHTLGGIITPANPNYTVEELQYQLSTTKAKVLVTHPDCIKTALSAAKAVGLPTSAVVLLDPRGPKGFITTDQLVLLGCTEPETYTPVKLKPGEARTKLAFLCFSSGTTGKPKAVLITHHALIANIVQMGAHFRALDPKRKSEKLTPGDTAIAVLPFFHIYGLFIFMHMLMYIGMTIVVVPKFNFKDFLKSIVKYNVTHLYMVPPQIVLLCKHPEAKKYDLSHVKFCMSGAAPLSGELMKQVIQVLPNSVIGQGYGLTETFSVSSIDPDVKIARVGSAGQLLPGIDAKIVKADGTLGKEGEHGELLVAGPCLALGYLNNPEANATTFVDGWFRTGDECVIKDGEIYVLERLKEILKVKGFQVAPAELEGHILLLPDIADACVVGLPDDYSGEVPLAFVVPSAKVKERIGNDPVKHKQLKDAVIKHVADAKSHYKWLTGGVEIVDVIPRTNSGKLLRRELRERAKAMAAAKPAKAKL